MTSLLLAVIYCAFISLGLPDALLGSAWPTMVGEFGVPVSWQGGVSTIISVGTICSALLSDRLTLRFGTGRVTVVSVAMTAVALFGFSLAPNYWILLAMAVPYGLGAGGVDAALNNYVALHYESRHMSWLHCMWGLGASAGPYIMGFALASDHGWQGGYRSIAFIQIALTAVLVLSLPLWKTREDGRSRADWVDRADRGGRTPNDSRQSLGFGRILAIRGARQIFVMFFCYCALESSAGLWASTYMTLCKGVDASVAARWGGLFFVGITVGRALSGFMTMRFSDPAMIRIGQAVLLCGVIVMLLPLPGTYGMLVGLIMIGLGCAPIYPCIIHSTPGYFGKERSQAIIGVQMASAYLGSLAMPPVFGLIAQYVSAELFLWYVLLLLVLMTVMHERLRSVCGAGDNGSHE